MSLSRRAVEATHPRRRSIAQIAANASMTATAAAENAMKNCPTIARTRNKITHGYNYSDIIKK